MLKDHKVTLGVIALLILFAAGVVATIKLFGTREATFVIGPDVYYVRQNKGDVHIQLNGEEIGSISQFAGVMVVNLREDKLANYACFFYEDRQNGGLPNSVQRIPLSGVPGASITYDQNGDIIKKFVKP